jgi:TetR/AcrR family fatty acid metabolism transcriptional regulator
MRRKEGNKEADILDAAVKVFAECGYFKAKMHTIADKAKVSTGSLYVYYPNKEKILLTIFDQLWKRLYSELFEISERNELTDTEKLDALIDLVFDIFTSSPQLALVFVNEQNHIQQKYPEGFAESYEMFFLLGERIIKSGSKEKVFNPNIDAKIFRLYVFGGLRYLLHQWAYDPQTYPLNKIRQNVKYMIKHGLLN